MRDPTVHQPIWTPIEAPAGYALELDTSRPVGGLRHRLLPYGEWREGNIPTDPSLEEMIGPSLTIEGENWTGEAREFLEEFDRRTKEID